MKAVAAANSAVAQPKAWGPLTVVATPLIIVIAAISWHAIEKPALRLKRWFGSGRRAHNQYAVRTTS